MIVAGRDLWCRHDPRRVARGTAVGLDHSLGTLAW